MADSESLASSSAGVTLTDFAQDIALSALALAKYPTGTMQMGRPARRIRINAGSGTLALVYASGVTGTRPNLAAGDVIDAQVTHILATGHVGITSVTVDY